MTDIRIQLNGEQRSIADKANLLELLDVFSLPEQRVAIELNGKVISRSNWPETFVSDGDRLEVVHFVGGG